MHHLGPELVRRMSTQCVVVHFVLLFLGFILQECSDRIVQGLMLALWGVSEGGEHVQ